MNVYIEVYYNGIKHTFKNIQEWDDFDRKQDWYKNGEGWENQFHRLDGPAVIWKNGREEYYINGKEYFEKDYLKEARKYKLEGLCEKI